MDVIAVVEDLLGAVAVVVVHIEDGDLGAGGARDVVGGDRRVVEEAVAAVEAARGVMSRRAAESVRGALASQDDLRRRHSGVHGRDRGPVRADRQRRRRLETPVAEPGEDRLRLASLPHLVAQRRPVEHIGHHVRRRSDHLLILLPRLPEEAHQSRVMDGENRIHAPLGRAPHHEPRIGRKHLPNGLGPADVLERRHHLRSFEGHLRVMAEVGWCVDNLHPAMLPDCRPAGSGGFDELQLLVEVQLPTLGALELSG